jgi:hypothetical protein
MHVLFGNVEIDPTISFEVFKQGVSLLQAYKDSYSADWRFDSWYVKMDSLAKTRGATFISALSILTVAPVAPSQSAQPSIRELNN